jgi:hypothetical protein
MKKFKAIMEVVYALLTVAVVLWSAYALYCIVDSKKNILKELRILNQGQQTYAEWIQKVTNPNEGIK